MKASKYCNKSESEASHIFYTFNLIAEYVLAGAQSECTDMTSESIVNIDNVDRCQKAVSDLSVVNPIVIEEDTKSMPKGCYVYYPANELYFNKHATGLPKGEWSDDTRKACQNMETMMEVSGGNFQM